MLSQKKPANSSSPLSKDELVKKGIESGEMAFTGPYGIQLGITNKCNYLCEFCPRFSYRRPDKSNDEEPFYQIERDKFLSLIESAGKLKVEQISIVGVSEPFLHKELPFFIKKITENSIRCMITSNGSLLTPETCEKIVDGGLDILNVSINAATPETYERLHGKGRKKFFPIILKNLSYLSSLKNGAKKPQLNLRYILTKSSLPEVATFLEIAARLKADEITLQHYVPPEFALDQAPTSADEAKALPILKSAKLTAQKHGIKTNIDFFLSRYAGEETDAGEFSGLDVGLGYYKKRPCYVGWTYAMILEDGKVQPCCYCGKSLGNINEKPFDEIWFGEEYNNFRKRAMALPEEHANIEGCHCFTNCGSIKDNIRTARRFNLLGGFS